jgi:DHA2 family multidrug resistance protein
VLLAGFLGSLEYVMEEGPRWDWLADPTVRNFAALGAVCGALFIHRTLTRPNTLVELRAFTDRNFAVGSLFSFSVGIGLYGSVYLIPLMMAAGFLLMALSIWMTADLTAQSSFAELALPLGLRGAAMMMAMLPVNQVALGTLPPGMLKNASGLYNLMRNLGGAIGLAAINTLAQDRSYLHRVQLGEAVTWGRDGATSFIDGLTAALGARLGEAADLAALRQVYAMVQREALVMAYNDVLVLMALLFVVIAPLAFLVARPRVGGEAGGGH